MKKISFASVLLMLTISFNVFSQINIGGTPRSFKTPEIQASLNNVKKEVLYGNLKLKDIDSHIIKADVNWDEIYAEDEFNNSIGLPPRVGFSLRADLNPENSGTWDVLPCGTLIWRLKISSPDAKSLSLIVDNFNMPEEAKLFVYDSNRKHVIGAFTNKNNNPSGVFTTHLIPGEELIIEYEQYKKGQEEQEIPSDFKFNIKSILFNYMTEGPFGETKDLSCMVNINCPEGDNWQKEKRGVAKILFRVGSDWYWCSGSLINNTNQDATPYFLTAEHCGGDATSADRDNWQFYFNNEKPGCDDSGTAPENMMLTGASLKSLGSHNGGSDFQLLLLDNEPPSSWNPYFNGWNRTTAASSAGVGIHHPLGDSKKISTYATTLDSATVQIGDEPMAQNSAWKVIWASTETNHSVTEGGSSGSPLFNNYKQIIGTLSGGAASCSNTEGPDYYGRFDFHWDKNGSTNNFMLKPWLDPAGTNPETLNGYDPNNSHEGESIFFEGFESSSIPAGWSQEHITGSKNWLTGVGNEAGYPSAAYEGSSNAYFKVESSSQQGYITRLITPSINIPSDRTAVLSLYLHNQVWQGDQDKFRIYYKNSTDGDWVLFEATNDNLDSWTYKSYYLPNPTSNYKIAFEAIAYWGHGVCIDNVNVGLLTGIHTQDIETPKAQIYPNPAQDIINISVFTDSPKYKISLLSIHGNVVKETSMQQNLKTIDISGLSAGIYFIRISGDSFSETLKFIKSE